jgi:hypothetical protein
VLLKDIDGDMIDLSLDVADAARLAQACRAAAHACLASDARQAIPDLAGRADAPDAGRLFESLAATFEAAALAARVQDGDAGATIAGIRDLTTA